MKKVRTGSIIRRGGSGFFATKKCPFLKPEKNLYFLNLIQKRQESLLTLKLPYTSYLNLCLLRFIPPTALVMYIPKPDQTLKVIKLFITK